jgi:hypothetical protein
MCITASRPGSRYYQLIAVNLMNGMTLSVDSKDDIVDIVKVIESCDACDFEFNSIMITHL